MKVADEKHTREALKDMIAQRSPNVPVEEVLVIFCERYGLSMEACRKVYMELVAKGEIKEK